MQCLTHLFKAEISSSMDKKICLGSVTFLLVFIFTLLSSEVDASESKPDIKRCHDIHTSLRLLCYDAETGYEANSAIPKPVEGCEMFEGMTQAYAQCVRSNSIPSQKPNERGKWLVRTPLDEISGRQNVFAFLRGNGANITLRCMNNTTAIYFDLTDYTTTGVLDGAMIEYRLDDRQKSRWFSSSGDGTAHGLWSGTQSIPFVKELISKTELAIRLPTYGGSRTVTYNITGIDYVVQSVREACNW